MFDLVPGWPSLAAFLVASVVLAITPGPGVIYIVTRSLLQGRRSGMASVAGVAVGNLGTAAGASLGLAALFATSSLAFLAMKYVGAAYLIYLGIQTIRRRGNANMPAIPGLPARRAFRDGLIVALFNPKTIIFFGAFLPQFIAVGEPPMAQGLFLGAVFVLIAAISDSAYALAAGSIAPRLTKSRNLGRIGAWFGGGTYVGLGIATALLGKR